MEAYRYPADFDAISAMAPANPMTDLMTQSMWAGWQPQRAAGRDTVGAQLAVVHLAAVKQCDKLDGVEDGLIGRPEACQFDPAMVEGLTPAQVETIRAIYQGPPGLPGWPVGSEMQLAVVAGGQTPFPVALTYYSMLAFGDRQGWDWKTFDYVRDAEAGRTYGASILDVPPTGLGPFFARGGKLLLSHGWSDGLIPANNTLKFYGGLRPTLSAEQAANQLRLFMVPGWITAAAATARASSTPSAPIDQWATTGTRPSASSPTRPDRRGGFPGAPAGRRARRCRARCAPYPAFAAVRRRGRRRRRRELSAACALVGG
jgi:hypothetical protein